MLRPPTHMFVLFLIQLNSMIQQSRNKKIAKTSFFCIELSLFLKSMYFKYGNLSKSSCKCNEINKSQLIQARRQDATARGCIKAVLTDSY